MSGVDWSRALSLDVEHAWVEREIARMCWKLACESPLGTRLAVAGALTKAYRNGRRVGFFMALDEEDDR